MSCKLKVVVSLLRFILYCYSYLKICLKENLSDHGIVWEIIFCETSIKLYNVRTILWTIKFSVIVHLRVENPFSWWNSLFLFFKFMHGDIKYTYKSLFHTTRRRSRPSFFLAFLLRAPIWNDVPVLLLNHSNIVIWEPVKHLRIELRTAKVWCEQTHG